MNLDSVRVRWLIARDRQEILAIENHSFPDHPWAIEEFTRCLRQRNCIGMVAEHEGRIIGYHVYEFSRDSLHILNFAVHRVFRRLGVGQKMLQKMISRLSPGRRNKITLEVRETNLEAQLFFRAMGFRATRVLRDFYEVTADDAYEMEFQYVATPADAGFDEFDFVPSAVEA